MWFYADPSCSVFNAIIALSKRNTKTKKIRLENRKLAPFLERTCLVHQLHHRHTVQHPWHRSARRWPPGAEFGNEKKNRSRSTGNEGSCQSDLSAGAFVGLRDSVVMTTDRPTAEVAEESTETQTEARPAPSSAYPELLAAFLAGWLADGLGLCNFYYFMTRLTSV